MTDTPKGPASYFPSIEKTYGQPVAHWLALIEGQKDLPHMKIVGWLKDSHGLGHGHANALVAHALGAKTPAPGAKTPALRAQKGASR